MNVRSQMQGGKNRILPKAINANRFLEIWKNHFCPSMGPNGGSVDMDSGMTPTEGMAPTAGMAAVPCLQETNLGPSFNCFVSKLVSRVCGPAVYFVLTNGDLRQRE